MLLELCDRCERRFTGSRCGRRLGRRRIGSGLGVRNLRVSMQRRESSEKIISDETLFLKHWSQYTTAKMSLKLDQRFAFEWLWEPTLSGESKKLLRFGATTAFICPHLPTYL
jgi:hypothetical protein